MIFPDLPVSGGAFIKGEAPPPEKGASSTILAARICSRDHGHLGVVVSSRGGCIIILSPVGLHQDLVDVLEVDGAGLVAHS